MMSQSKIFAADSSKNNIDTTTVAFIQDTIHIGTKFRNRLLAQGVTLVMGHSQVSVGHLKILLREFPKEKHGLVLSDICPEDRQNFESLSKIMDPNVSKLLTENISDSKGTVMYLKLCYEITSSFLDCEITPEERLYRIWHAVYFLRLWRESILKNNEYSLKNNFITSNAYICVEINAYFLIHLIIKLRGKKRCDQFLPYIFSSQACESTFRQMRSLSTINWTKVNFSLLELFHSIGRIELLVDIMHNKLKDTTIEFPRIKEKNNKVMVFDLPSNEVIQKNISKAKEEAIKDARNLGIQLDVRAEISCKIVSGKNSFENILEHNLDDEIQQQQELLKELTISPHPDTANVSSSFLDIIDKNGNSKKVRKSSIVSLLSTTKANLSSDRLRRVQGPSNKSSCKRLEFISEEPGFAIYEAQILRIGDWCIFKNNKKLKAKDLLNEYIIVGIVVAIRYSGKKRWQQILKSDCASVSPRNKYYDDTIEVLASWHSFKKDGSVCNFENNCNFYISIKNYVASLERPDNTNTEIIFKHFDIISDKLLTLLKTK